MARVNLDICIIRRIAAMLRFETSVLTATGSGPLTTPTRAQEKSDDLGAALDRAYFFKNQPGRPG